MSVLRHVILPLVACMLCMMGPVTPVCIEYYVALLGLYLYEFELCCDAMLYSTYLHVMRMCDVYCYVWDPTT